MKISGSYDLAATQSRAYELLQDPEVLAKCIPGCDRLERVGENEFKLTMKMLIASLSGQFDSRIRITEQRAPESFRLSLHGSGRIGFVNAQGLLALRPRDSSTEIAYDGEVQIGGTIASVGQRLLDGTSKMLLKKFFETFSSLVASV